MLAAVAMPRDGSASQKRNRPTLNRGLSLTSRDLPYKRAGRRCAPARYGSASSVAREPLSALTVIEREQPGRKMTDSVSLFGLYPESYCNVLVER